MMQLDGPPSYMDAAHCSKMAICIPAFTTSQVAGIRYLKSCRPDLDAVQLDLKPTISSKANVASGWGQAVNAGVSLTILKELALAMGVRSAAANATHA